MKDKENRIYSLREIIPEILKNNESNESEVRKIIPGIIKDYESNESEVRKIYRYYEAYKKMEDIKDPQNRSDDRICAEDKDMVVRNIKKMLEEPEYMKFVNNANKKDFTLLEFFKLMKEEKNRRIYNDLYLDGLHKLDNEYYNFSVKDIDTYIKNVEYKESSEELISMADSLELLVATVFSIENSGNRIDIMSDLKLSMEKTAKKAMEYINRQNYVNRITYVVSELRLVSRVEDLPIKLFREYMEYNDFDKVEYDENEFPKDNITDEMIYEIVDRYYAEIDENRSIEVEKFLKKLSNRLEEKGFEIKNID